MSMMNAESTTAGAAAPPESDVILDCVDPVPKEDL
jgi:hypothetical protein